MSSNLSIEYKRLNKGKCISFRYGRQIQYENKALEIMGIFPVGTFCYICGCLATQDYVLIV